MIFRVSQCRSQEKAEENRIRLKANEFIYEQMAVFYLWNKQMWSDKPDENRDPIDYFEGLLASNDPWSRITDNANEFIKSLEGTGETFGFSISFGWINSEKTRIGAVVNYVYPQSPAANVGLKRGSLIIEVDGEAMTEDNYTRLHDLGSHQLTLGEITQYGIAKGATIHISSKVMDLNPVLMHKIIEKGEHKIGYLMYTSFKSNFNTQLEEVLTEFKNHGITDLVLDLRNNTGGDDAASTLLASSIVPKEFAHEGQLMGHERWNDLCQAEWEKDSKYDHYINNYFKSVDCNLELPKKRVYILANNYSISASEYLILVLRPFMDVIHIGETTYGKFTTLASFQAISEDDDTKLDSDIDNWLIFPVVSRYTNIKYQPTNEEGLKPDYTLEDNALDSGDLGSIEEDYLKKAYSLITGEELPDSFNDESENGIKLEPLSKPLLKKAGITGYFIRTFEK